MDTFKKVYRPAKIFGALKNTHCVCLAQGEGDKEKIVAKHRYRHQYQVAYPCYSVSKSIVSIACGILYDRGLLRPEDKLCDHLGEYFFDGIDENWYRVTLTDLFHHTTGAAEAIDYDVSRIPSDEDPLLSLLRVPIVCEPGTKRLYSDGNYYVLARVAEKLAGKPVDEFMREEVFAPLGFNYYAWAKDNFGHVLGGSGMFLRTEDMAVLTRLWQQKGTLRGRRYFSEEWADKCFDIDYPDNHNYGFGITKICDHVYNIGGMNGQGNFFDLQKDYVFSWHSHNSTPFLGFLIMLHKLHLI